MEIYIKDLRQKGYTDWIQVFRIIEKNKNGKEMVSWIKMGEPLSGQIKERDGFYLTGINQYFDNTNKLDHLDFIFEQTENRNNEIIESKKEPNTQIERSNEYYWKPIRKFIGHEKILAIGVNSFIQNDKGEIAAVKRRDDGNWSFPAGAREIGELPSETIANEMKEETSVLAKAERLCCLYTVPLTYPNGDIYEYLIALYKMKLIEGELKVNDYENLDVKWMDIEEARKLFTGGWKKRLEFYLNYKEEDGVVVL